MMGSLPSLAALSFPARRSSDLVGVDEVRGRPGVSDGIGSRCECHRRGGNDVAEDDSPDQQTEVEGSGAGAQGEGVAASEAVGQRLLVSVHQRTERVDTSYFRGWGMR